MSNQADSGGNGPYRHDDFSVRTVNMTADEHRIGHPHCQHLFIGTSCHLPIIERSLELGQWQRIFLVELIVLAPDRLLSW